MTVTVQLSPDLVESLQALAGQHGQDLDSTIERLLKEQLQRETKWNQRASSAAAREIKLLEQIQQGLPEARWQRYRELQAKRVAERLTPDEHRELIRLADEIEGWNVRRLELAHRVAKLRGVSWDAVVEELGLATSSGG